MLNINWKNIPPEYKYAAMDRYGPVFVYTVPPVLVESEEIWALPNCAEEHHYKRVKFIHNSTRYDWRRTLERRNAATLIAADLDG